MKGMEIAGCGLLSGQSAVCVLLLGLTCRISLCENRLIMKTMYIPEAVQRRIALFTPEGGTRATTGDTLFGQRDAIARDQQCTCGICLAPDPASTQCTLLRGGARVLQRRTTELCKAVCVSRSPLRMLLKFLKTILEVCHQRHTGQFRSVVRITLQVDREPGDMNPRDQRPYLLNAVFDQHTYSLDVDFEQYLMLDDHTHDLGLNVYLPGDDIHENSVSLPVRDRVEQALLDANAKPSSLVIIAPDMDEGDFNIGSIRFRDVGHTFRAEPLYLYVW